MRIASDVESGKACLVNQLAGELEQCVRQGAEDGRPLHEIEQTIHETVLRMGHAAMKLFLSLQPDDDAGRTCCVTWQRWTKSIPRIANGLPSRGGW